MKGVSAIIATILMLIITIGLAGTAYVYISGIMTGRTAKTISLMDASCSGGDIVIVIANDGSLTVDGPGGDLGVWIDNADATATCDEETLTIDPHTTAVMACPGTGTTGEHTILITSPTNSGRINAYCA